MDLKDDISSIASIIGEPARAVMLWSLLDGQARPAGELAFYANVSAQSASTHLAKLVAARMLTVQPQGRHRYYRITGPEVAQAVEAIAVLANPERGRLHLPRGQTPDLKFARTCYDHLAGRVAVEIAQGMQNRGLLARTAKDFRVTPRGELWLRDLGIDTDVLRRRNRNLARQCMDWSERQHHIAGALGAALFDAMLALKWIGLTRTARVVRVTLEGRKALSQLLDLPF